MAEWVRIATIDQCPPGEGREFVVQQRIIALFHLDGQFYALDGICPHQGGPLAEGRLSGCVVTCPWHGWQFDVTTGHHQINPNLAHASYPVKVEGRDVYVDLAR